MIARATTYWTMLKICLEERLVYRGDFALGTLMRFLPIVTQVFLWGAIFASIDAGKTVVGYTYRDMIAYYLLAMVTRAFSSMPGLASGIAVQIRNGEIKKFLIQPVDLLGFLLMARIAHKLVYYAVAILPFAFVFYVCRDYFSGWPPADVMTCFVLSLLMAFLLGFFLEATIGMIGFWWLEVSSLLFVYMLFNFILSGHMFPVDMLEQTFLGSVVRILPFQYLAYFPAAVFLGKVSGPELITGMWIQLGWLVFFIFAARLAFHFGVRRYSGFGG
jgi:ABC-2 type transport system permease protein